MNLFCNVFNDPSSPWYYVIGVLFLLLVFGALALYIVFSKKLKKPNGEENKSADAAENPESPDGANSADKSSAENSSQSNEEIAPETDIPDSDKSK
ncbi:MAG: hypothetical protein OSJ83_05290 [Clostridia bacterium]|nr:hypothetical protein [Clostridia bacterium]